MSTNLNYLFYEIRGEEALPHILDCISSIDEHLENRKVYHEYLSSKTKRRAVERELEIIGEAVNKLLKLNPLIKISFSRQIVDLRNKVTHAYDSVNDAVIWNVAVNHLPTFEAEVEGLDFN